MVLDGAITGTRRANRPTVLLKMAVGLPAYALVAAALVSTGYRLGQSAAVDPMPEAAPHAEQRTLYLTAGGMYTPSDIAANGGETAADHYRGQMPRHDPHPLKGDQVCPITDTKANPRFTWVVSGKTYTFCCPACIDEFMSRARKQPSSILPPEQYVKR